MTAGVEARRTELVGLRARLLIAAEDIAGDDDDDGELNSAMGDQHLADHATDMIDREIDDTLGENAEHVIQEIDKALQRLDDGTYGTCAVCGEQIPEERLAAVPYATLCVKDKRAQEHG
jgi:DnaK suppressor protein